MSVTRATSSSPFQLLTALPPQLLAHIASCHLDIVTVLRLQRCSSTLHRVYGNDASYMTTAWRWAELRVFTDKRLHEWTLPYEECIVSGRERLIPVSMWQAALPGLEAALHACPAETTLAEFRKADMQLTKLLEGKQRTRCILTKCAAQDAWEVFDKASAAQSTDVRRVEVLRDVDWWQLDRRAARTYCDVEVRCRLILRACPYLQHLHLVVSTYACEAPRHEDTYALVPRLRSLRLEQQCGAGHTKPDLVFDIRAMLHSLPLLHTLHFKDIHHLTVSDLLYIASHSTLEELHITSGRHGLEDCDWLGSRMRFPIDVEEEAEDAATTPPDGDGEEEDAEALQATLIDYMSAAAFSQQLMSNVGERTEEQHERDEVRAELWRMHAALTRTQPSQRSCAVRLALAGWLHRRLRRGGLRTDNHRRWRQEHPMSLLHRYRLQVALLRSTLQQQQSRVAAADAEAAAQISPSALSLSELSRIAPVHADIHLLPLLPTPLVRLYPGPRRYLLD